jgi:hypothetical protein
MCRTLKTNKVSLHESNQAPGPVPAENLKPGNPEMESNRQQAVAKSPNAFALRKISKKKGNDREKPTGSASSSYRRNGR